MIGIEYARASQFNWTYDNMGGTPLQAVFSGLWSGVSFPVQSGQIVIPEVQGGGRVYYFRGAWGLDALFAWGGFWVEPESGATNYFTGGTFQNVGNETIVSLGNPPPDGTMVQAYYIYNTGERAAKYESLNSTPCIRRAWRAANDYTYDYAVDRIFDAMAAVYFAYRERGLDAENILQFFWDSYIDHAASNGNPLVFDDFSRAFYDKGSHLLYANSTQGRYGLEHFGTVLPPDDFSLGRALRFKPEYYLGPAFSAWCGYGFNWDLTQQYFEDISKIMFKVRGANVLTRVQKFIKTAGTGTSNMILIDNFNLLVARYYLITVTEAGPPGVAKALLQVYNQTFQLINDADEEDEIEGEIITCATNVLPVQLGHGLTAYWQPGTLEVGDVFYVVAGNQEIHPNRLLVSLNDSLPSDPDPWGESHTFFHGVCDYYPEWRSFEIPLSQFWRLGNVIDCRDRRPGRWGNWSEHNMVIGHPYEVLFYDVEDEFEADGETFYTKQRFTWNLDPVTTVAFGFWVSPPPEVLSTGRTNINYLIRQENGANLTITTKVRDANGAYFYHNDVIPPGQWVRNTVAFAAFLPVSGTPTLTHPITLVDIGMISAPLVQGGFDLADLKFDNHVTFSGGENLRIVEFKHIESNLRLAQGPDWYLDDFGFDLAVEDPYPYVPRLAISLNAYGRNPWRGPTLIHYSHPLAPFLVNRLDIKNTELALHKDAQAEFFSRYGGIRGPIMPVHNRNDIENVALTGEENFNKFSWWPDYPEAGHALGQYWAFYRLAEYFFVSNDAGAWEVLDHWLNWLDAVVVADGDGWKFPMLFGDEHAGGFDYGDYDPGAAASLAIGALYVYMRNGDSRASTLAGNILGDLRANRASGDFGGYLYKSDYHYAWMNALVAHAFGMAVTGRVGAAYVYPFTTADETHFVNIINNFWTMSGDGKPNLLNSDLIPFHNVEASDLWDYAPNYLFMKEMGSMEAVVLMMHVALDWALYDGSYFWFNSLLEFLIRLGEAALAQHQIYAVHSNFVTSNVVTKVNLSYGDYRRDNSLFVEVSDPGMAGLLGEKRQQVQMFYGSPVITEDANTAAKIAARMLAYFSTPKEQVQVVADLSAARVEMNDVVRIESPFHGFDRDKFLLTKRTYDQRKLRVTLDLMRPGQYSPAWAVDVAGSEYDSYAIDHDSEQDDYWADRAYAN